MGACGWFFNTFSIFYEKNYNISAESFGIQGNGIDMPSISFVKFLLSRVSVGCSTGYRHGAPVLVS